MSSAMDRAMMEMSLDEEDIEVSMPDLPEFCSHEQNSQSIIGRLLNPDCQKMSSLIHDLPRKWQKVGKVHGVALSKERFQFIFRNNYDLEEVLEKGLQTYNEWPLAMERWKEIAPPNFLQLVPIWVQIKNIPLNYYTEGAITFLGDLVGPVTEMAFDPHKPQNRDYVRVKILFDVSKPPTRERVINLPDGDKETVSYYYEKVQKRCYNCQRMTHEKLVCPILIKQKLDLTMKRNHEYTMGVKIGETALKESDPLFGVLNENQVGLNSTTGRPRIAEEVLEGMRQYLKVASGEERKIREERVKKSVKEVEEDPMMVRTVLRLEPPSLVTRNLSKGKGIFFGYETANSSTKLDSPSPCGEKLLAAAMQSDKQLMLQLQQFKGPSDEMRAVRIEQLGSTHNILTVQRSGSIGAGSSGNALSKLKPRGRPNKSKRKSKPKDHRSINELIEYSFRDETLSMEKRKADEDFEGRSKFMKVNADNLMVPKEGPSSD